MKRPTRRTLLCTGGALLAGAATRLFATAASIVEIRMQGDASGSNVWFDPIGIYVEPGQVIRWLNVDTGNSHTATAYHPRMGNHPQRIPALAAPWNSDYLLPGETFELTVTVSGVYDYFCIPHEHAGMVGRIVVGAAPMTDPPYPGNTTEALRGLPSVRSIMSSGQVRPR